MEVELLYFGMIAEATGTNTEALELEAQHTVEELRAALISRHPSLNNIKFQVAVNEEIADATSEVPNNAKVALLPPFAGG